MKIIQCDQGTQEWFDARKGIPSSSNFDKIITSKGQPSKQAEKYLFRLAGERLSGIVEESYSNQFMERGRELEAEARSFYEFTTGKKVEQVGFCTTDDGRVGCSPDGLVGKTEGVEIKCPIMSTHVAYMLSPDKLLSEYWQQVQGSLYVTKRKAWSLISYYPALKPVLINVKPDKAFQKQLGLMLEAFCNQLDEIVEKLK